MKLRIPIQEVYVSIVKFNIAWAFLFPFVLAILMSEFKATPLFILKDLVFYFSFLLVFFLGRSKGLLIYMFYILLFVIYIFITTIIFFELNTWMVYNLRQILSPLLIFGFGYYLLINASGFEKIIKYLYKTTFWVIIIGIVFLLIDIWDYIYLKNYFNAKGIPVDEFGVSYMFYEPAFGYVRRMVSTVLDPISLGHMIAAPLILCYYSVNISGATRKKYLVVFFIGLILTMSKGAILQVVLALFFFNKNLSKIKRFLVPAVFVLLVLLVINIKGILIHLIGFKNAIVYLNLFGHGIGMVGNYAKMFADDLTVYYQFHISDTFIGAIIGQLGVLGFILWISFFVTKIKGVFSSKTNMIGAIILMSQMFISIISENTLNFTSFIISGIVSGMLIRHNL